MPGDASWKPAKRLPAAQLSPLPRKQHWFPPTEMKCLIRFGFEMDF